MKQQLTMAVTYTVIAHSFSSYKSFLAK